MAARTRTLIVEIVGDARKLRRTFDDAERRGRGFAGTVGKLGGVLGGALAGGALIAGVKKVTDAGSDLNETTNKIGLAFGKNAGVIQAWAANSAKQMGLPKQAALENASSFGLLFSKLGIAGGASAKMSQQMVQLAVDLGSVHNADPTQILEAQAAAFRGEYDALQRFVPAINAAAVEQEALSQTHKTSAKELTNAEKAQAVYSLMLKQTTKEQGDFARTSEDAANKTKINAARFKDLQANIGTVLLPAVTALTNGLGSLATWVERNRTAAILLGGAIVAVTGFVIAWNAATKVAAAVQGVIRGATLAWAVAQRVLNFALAANPIGLVVVAVAALVGALVFAYKHSETFRRIVDGAFRAVATAAKWMWEHVLKPIFRFIVNNWLLVAGAIVHGAAAAFGWVPGIGPKLRTVANKFDEFAASVNKSLGSIDDEKVNVTARASVEIARSTRLYLRAANVPGFHAKGGLTRLGEVAIVGEEGPELVQFKNPARVFTAPQTRQILDRGMADGGEVGVQFSRAGSLHDLALWQSRVTLATERIGERFGDRIGRSIGAGLAKLIAKATVLPPHAPGGWQVAVNFLRRLGMAFQVISTFRPGARTHASGAQSYHALNRAVDIAGPNMLAIFEALIRTNPTELIYSGASRYKSRRGWRPIGALDPITLADHWSHVHAAYDNGGMLPPGVSVAVNRTGRPEPVGFDYRRMGDAVADALAARGMGAVYLDGRKVSRELAPTMRGDIRQAQRRELIRPARQLA